MSVKAKYAVTDFMRASRLLTKTNAVLQIYCKYSPESYALRAENIL